MRKIHQCRDVKIVRKTNRNGYTDIHAHTCTEPKQHDGDHTDGNITWRKNA